MFALLTSTKALKIVRFIISGTISAIGNLCILFVLVDFFHLFYLSASIISFICSIGLGFVLQKFWTFRDNALDGVHFQVFRYVIIAVLNLAINTGLMYLLVSILGLWYMIAQIVTAGIIAFWSYAGYKTFVFTSSHLLISDSSR